MKHVVIVGGGFAGLNAAKELGHKPDLRITVIDRSNHHLFQPLLYQVAMAALSPAEIAVPIRHILTQYHNITVLQDEVCDLDLSQRQISARNHTLDYDYLILACGANHSYFGHEEWEEYAPGLKTIEQATEIRRRVLTAFEAAEWTSDPEQLRKLMTFVIIGGGPTGVELAGAIGEMSRFTLAQDFRHINPKLAHIILVEAGPRLLPSFAEKLAQDATDVLENIGVQVRTSSTVTGVDQDGVTIGQERVAAATILWAAGVQASGLGRKLGVITDPMGRVPVEPGLNLKDHPEVFVAGDMAHFAHGLRTPLPGLAPVALQQGRWIGKNILRQIDGQPPLPFHYLDKGQLATIGRSKAIIEWGRFRSSGLIAWFIWLIVHIYYLIGFKNRLFVTMQWAWSFFGFHRGARLIITKEWRFFRPEPPADL